MDQNLESNPDYILVLQHGAPVVSPLQGGISRGPLSFIDGSTSGFSISTTSGGGSAFTQSITISNPATARTALNAAQRATPAIAGATIPLAKITGGGVDGSIQVNSEGIIVSYTAPT